MKLQVETRVLRSAVDFVRRKQRRMSKQMKATVLKKRLHESLGVVGRNVSAQSTLPVMKAVLIDAQNGRLRLTGADNTRTTEMGVEATVSQPGTMALEARALQEIVSSLREGDLTMALMPPKGDGAGDQCLIVSGQTAFRLPVFDPADYPATTDVEDLVQFKVSEKALGTAFRHTEFAASDDDTRPLLTSILMRVTQDGSLTVVATDTHRLPVSRAEVKDANLPNASHDFLLPSSTVRELMKALGDSDEAMVTVRADANQAQFEAGTLRVTSRLMEGVYPKFERVVPSTTGIKVTVNRNNLREILRRVRIVARKAVVGGSVLLIAREHTLVAKAIGEGGGKAREEMDAHREGDEIRLGFNVEYLIDALESFQTETVTLEFTSTTGASVVRPVGGEKAFCVVMPLQDTGFADTEDDAEDFRLV